MVREPVVANQFYPGNKDTLSRALDEMLKATPRAERIPGRILGIAVPHAGYPYSGPTAACAYNAIRGMDIKTVVLIGPTHKIPFTGFAVYGKGAWKTPLGRVEIDEELAAEIIKIGNRESGIGVRGSGNEPLIMNLPEAHSREHSIEVQIPFLQKVLTNFKIVPIMSCEPGYDDLKLLGKALAKTCKDKGVLIVASSDLYHGPSSRVCERTDSTTLGLIERFDPKGLYDGLTDGSASACGGAPITALMLAMKELGADKVQVLHRTNSFEVTGQGEGDWVVGYAAIAFYDESSRVQEFKSSKEEAPESEGSKDAEGMLNTDEQAELLRIARTTLNSTIRKGKLPDFKPLTDRLKENRGVFVTLREKGELRGCIGYIEGIAPLYRAVKDMAIAASTEDYRFPPVKPSELEQIDIEITVLTPLVRSLDPVKDIVLGKHGIVVKQGSRQGVFLPQVATETGWNTEMFLSQCCAGKAGLPSDAWKNKDCEVCLFQGQIFGEKE